MSEQEFREKMIEQVAKIGTNVKWIMKIGAGMIVAVGIIASMLFINDYEQVKMIGDVQAAMINSSDEDK